ncbi:MAG: hypothetical protein FWE17_02625, partial [Alphaproteobacteria bacterium]|nr:hypothetical protein [Alphaproteobacteria bacterium]
RHGKPDTIRLEFHGDYGLFKDDNSVYGNYSAPSRSDYGSPFAKAMGDGPPPSAPPPAAEPGGPDLSDVPDDM